MVHGANFPDETSPVMVGFSTGKGGHACGHWPVIPSCCLVKSKKRLRLRITPLKNEQFLNINATALTDLNVALKQIKHHVDDTGPYMDFFEIAFLLVKHAWPTKNFQRAGLPSVVDMVLDLLQSHI
jgi:hypothetical protein